MQTVNNAVTTRHHQFSRFGMIGAMVIWGFWLRSFGLSTDDRDYFIRIAMITLIATLTGGAGVGVLVSLSLSQILRYNGQTRILLAFIGIILVLTTGLSVFGPPMPDFLLSLLLPTGISAGTISWAIPLTKERKVPWLLVIVLGIIFFTLTIITIVGITQWIALPTRFAHPSRLA